MILQKAGLSCNSHVRVTNISIKKKNFFYQEETDNWSLLIWETVKKYLKNQLNKEHN